MLNYLRNTGLRKTWPASNVKTVYTWKYYAKLGFLYFVAGGLFELIMAAAGLYNYEYHSGEAVEKALEKKKNKREFLRTLQNQAGKRLEEKKIIPPRNNQENEKQ